MARIRAIAKVPQIRVTSIKPRKTAKAGVVTIHGLKTPAGKPLKYNIAFKKRK